MKNWFPKILLVLVFIFCSVYVLNKQGTAESIDEQETDTGGIFDEGFDDKEQISGETGLNSFFDEDEDIAEEERIDGKFHFKADEIKTAAVADAGLEPKEE